MRNRAFFFFSLVMPLIFLFGAVTFSRQRRDRAWVAYILGAILTLTVMGSFWGLSVQLVTFREQGILRRFRLAPVGAGPMLASSILSNYFMALPVVISRFWSAASRSTCRLGKSVGDFRAGDPRLGHVFVARADRRQRDEHHAGNADDQQPDLDGISFSFRRDDSAWRCFRIGCSASRFSSRRSISPPACNPRPQTSRPRAELLEDFDRARARAFRCVRSVAAAFPLGARSKSSAPREAVGSRGVGAVSCCSGLGKRYGTQLYSRSARITRCSAAHACRRGRAAIDCEPVASWRA